MLGSSHFCWGRADAQSVARINAHLFERDIQAGCACDDDFKVVRKQSHLLDQLLDEHTALAAAFEALIGAIYTDGGIGPAQRVVEFLFTGDIGGPAAERDYKTELQELAYRRFRTQPIYELVSAEGPDHAKRFTTRIRIGGREFGNGSGGSKKQSEQAAAREALDQIGQEIRGRRA